MPTPPGRAANAAAAARAGRRSCCRDVLQRSWHAPWRTRLPLFETIADPIEGLDHFEFGLDHFELLAKPLDVAVDSAVVNVDLIVVGRVHQGVSAFDHARTRRE